jgi:hypothetical protein
MRYGHAWPLWKAILASWAIALLECRPAVPANRLGHGQFSRFQLKIIQEVVTLLVFIGFAVLFLWEKLVWKLSRSVCPSRRGRILRLCVQDTGTD